MNNPLLTSKYWAMEESRLRKLMDFSPPSNTQQAPAPKVADKPYCVVNGVAVIPLVGVFTKYPDAMLDYYGIQYVSTVEASQNFNAAVNDDQVRAICIYVDSPGGDVAGTGDLADAIGLSDKPVTAYISDLGASAAYWVASQADEVWANPTAEVGSIGVYTVLADTTKAYDEMGVKLTLVKAGASKGGGADGKIDDATVSDTQRVVNEIYEVFVSAVADGRHLTEAKARSIATGQVWIAGKAKGLGLIDGIASMDDVLGMLSGGQIMGEAKIEGKAGAKLAQAVEAVVADVKAGLVTVADVVADAVAAEVKAADVTKVEASVEGETLAADLAEATAEVAAALGLPPVIAADVLTLERPKFEKLVADAVDTEKKVKAAHDEGYQLAQEHEKQRFAALLEVCKGKPTFAVDQFLKGHDKGKCAIEYAAAINEQMSATKGESDGVQAIATQVADRSVSYSTDFGAMWDGNADDCQKKFSSKENFTAFKKYEATRPAK